MSPSEVHAPARSSAHATLVALAISALLAASLFGLVQAARAGQTVIVFTDFSDVSDLDLNGNAAQATEGAAQVLRLTPATTSQSGTAFLLDPITLADEASFSTSFSFQITASSTGGDSDGGGADGLAFIVQTNSSSAGGSGGGIGYAGIDNSVAVEFDTYYNGGTGEPDGNHIGISLDGNVASVATASVATRFNDGNIWYVWVDYDGATDALEVRASQTNVRPVAASLTYTVDLETVLGTPDAFVGFGSGTGSFYGAHDIRTWEFINAFNPVGLNEPPVANAGPDQTVTQTGTATSVTLDGTGSTDPDGDPLTYAWAGPFVEATATGPNPTVTFATAGAHVVTLVVDDGNGGTDDDTVTITVQAPTAATPTPTPTPSPSASALPNTAATPGGWPLTGLAIAAALALLVTAVVLLVSAHALAFARDRRSGRPLR